MFWLATSKSLSSLSVSKSRQNELSTFLPPLLSPLSSPRFPSFLPSLSSPSLQSLVALESLQSDHPRSSFHFLSSPRHQHRRPYWISFDPQSRAFRASSCGLRRNRLHDHLRCSSSERMPGRQMAYPFRRRQQSGMGSERFVVRGREQVDIEFLLVRSTYYLRSEVYKTWDAHSLSSPTSLQVRPFPPLLSFLQFFIGRSADLSRSLSVSFSLSIDLRRYGVQTWWGGQVTKNMIGAIWPQFYRMKNHFPGEFKSSFGDVSRLRSLFLFPLSPI